MYEQGRDVRKSDLHIIGQHSNLNRLACKGPTEVGGDYMPEFKRFVGRLLYSSRFMVMRVWHPPLPEEER